MRALIFPHLTRITSRFTASVAQSGDTPLILRASNTTTRFSIRLSDFCNFTPRIHQKRSHQVRNPKFSWGACSYRPSSRRPTCALITYWNPPFQNSRSATAHHPLHSFLHTPLPSILTGSHTLDLPTVHLPAA